MGNILKEKSMEFAVRIVKLHKYLNEKKAYSMADQILRSGTAIGAMQREAEHAESKADFVHKYGIAQKECNETLYWLELLFRSEYITEKEFYSLFTDEEELMKLITSSIKTVKYGK